MILGKALTSSFTRDLQANIIQILSRRDLLEKHLYSHIGHREEFKDGMSSDAIEEEPSHLEATPILSPLCPH